MIFGDSRLPHRFWKRVHVAPSGCWEWTGAKASGRGQLRWKCSDGAYRSYSVYRLAFETEHGDIDSALTIDHLCENPSCCNPAHLEQVTAEENTRRWNEKHPVTHCPKGHAKTNDNVYINSVGGRICKICHAEKMRAYKARVRRPRIVRLWDTAGVIRAARTAAQLRLQDLAAVLEIKHNTLSTWERGIRPIATMALPKLVAVLGVNAEQLRVS